MTDYKKKTAGLYQAILWAISNKIGRPARVVDIAAALGITRQATYNKISTGKWTMEDLEKVCIESDASLYVAVAQSSGAQLQQRMFPLYETDRYVPDFSPKLKTPVTVKVPKE